MASLTTNCAARAQPRDVARGDWRWLGVALIGGLILWLYAGVLKSLVSDWWTDPGASYGFLVPPFALYLAYVRRNRTFALAAAADYRGLWVSLAACVLFLVGKLGVEYFLTRFSLVVLLAGLTWTFWGLPRTRTLAFPLLLLVTAIPIPILIYNRIALPLQLLASQTSANVIRLFGESVYQDGNILQLPHTTLGVAEACSGLHSLASLVVAALILAFAQFTRFLPRLALVALSVPLAIAVNVFRVTGAALLANYDEQYAEGFYHGFSGWLVFVAGFGLLWLLAKGLGALAERRHGGSQ